jgi:hypothetical protein
MCKLHRSWAVYGVEEEEMRVMGSARPDRNGQFGVELGGDLRQVSLRNDECNVLG